MKKNRANEGYVVVISLVVATAVLLLLSVFLGSTVTERKNVERSYRIARALNLAEAGIEKAIWELSSNPTSDSSGTISIEGVGDCEYTSAVSGNTATIQATGYVPGIAVAGRVARKVKVVAESSKTKLFNYGLFANEGPITLNDSFVDSYNSTVSSYTAQATNDDPDSGYTYANSNASVGTNSSDPSKIVLDDDSKIFGETVLDAKAELPQPVVPTEFDYSLAGISVSGNDTYTIDNPGTYEIGFISVSGNGVVQINESVTIYVAGDVRVNDLDITGQGEIRIASGVSATFYVNGDMKVAGNGMVNLNSDPSALIIYGTPSTSNIQIMGNAAFCGLVYAPEAHVKIKGAQAPESAVLYGAVVANSIEIGPHGKIHYDEALKDRTDFIPPWAARYRVVRWEEKR